MERDPKRARGTLRGQAVGDALGTTQEFTKPSHVEPFPAYNEGPQTEIIGEGPFGLEPGQVTDDTQLAVCIADSLRACDGLDPADIAGRYVDWMDVAFDIGNLTRASMQALANGRPPDEAGFVVWEGADRRPAGNGSLMRSSPLAVFHWEDAATLRDAALTESAITHADPRCRIACAAFGAAIRHALVDPEATPDTMRRTALVEVPEAGEAIDDRTPDDRVEDAVEALTEDLEIAARDHPELDSDEVHYYRTAGFVRVAFRLAFWHLLHAESFEAAVLDCTNRGGDSDTNAAITGALYGSLAGEGAIPVEWRDRVAQAGEEMAEPFRETYHPTRLLRLVEE